MNNLKLLQLHDYIFWSLSEEDFCSKSFGMDPKILQMLNAVDRNKSDSLVLQATKYRQNEFLKTLLNNGFKPDYGTDNENTAIWDLPIVVACFESYFDTFKILVDAGASLKPKENFSIVDILGESLCRSDIGSDSVNEIMNYLFKNNFVFEKNPIFNFSTQREFSTKHLNAIKNILSYGYDINDQTLYGLTILHCRRYQSFFDQDVLTGLLDMGIDPSIENHEGVSGYSQIMESSYAQHESYKDEINYLKMINENFVMKKTLEKTIGDIEDFAPKKRRM